MSESQSNSPAIPIEKLVQNLVDIGTVWAKYGLGVGKLALETSSKTLNSTAEVLGEVAKRFETTSKS